MKLFISWSGSISKDIAKVFREWVPVLNKDIKPYMSAEDIEKGAHWSSHIRGELSDTSFGILILTRENISSPWLHFEAGAIAKSVEDSRMVPILFGLSDPDVQQPLSLFQTAKFEKDEIWKVVLSLNEAAGMEAAPDGVIEDLFETFWPRLNAKVDPFIKMLRSTAGSPKEAEKAESDKIIRELLTLSRQQMHILTNPHDLFGRELLSLLVRLLREEEGAAVRLTSDEKNLALALVARWKSQQPYLQSVMDQLPAGQRIRALEVITRFSQYVDELNKVLVGAIDPSAVHKVFGRQFSSTLTQQDEGRS